MSSILKALKKLESEKGKRDQLSTAVSSDILRGSRKVRSGRIPLVACFLVAILIAASAGYFYAQSQKTASQSRVVVIDDQAPPVDMSRPAESLPIQTGQPAATIKLPELSGIVYQQDPASRLAIVNDLPVMEGTLVEGFTVKRIAPDRLILVRDGNDYTLLLSQE